MLVNLAEAIRLLQQGEVVAIPTETVYGLAADAHNETAIAKIYAIKQRPATNPLIVHIPDTSHVLHWASTFPPLAQEFANAFWPGPLTLVLPANQTTPTAVRGGEATIGLRIPNHPVAHELLERSGLSLAAPSANKYTQLSPTTATHVEMSLGKKIPVLEGGPCNIGIESTIVSVSENEWQILRPGMIDESLLISIAGSLPAPIHQNSPKSPGQHLLHYSPRTVCKIALSRMDLELMIQAYPNAVALVFDNPLKLDDRKYICLSNDPDKAAEQLYAALHTLDSMGAELILIEPPPISTKWAALNDRLKRASYS